MHTPSHIQQFEGVLNALQSASTEARTLSASLEAAERDGDSAAASVLASRLEIALARVMEIGELADEMQAGLVPSPS